MAKRFEAQVREDRFYEYFERVNARGDARDPGDAFAQMIRV